MSARLDTLPEDELLAELAGCCASDAWARAFLRRRPFADAQAAMAASDDAFDELTEQQWRAAFVGVDMPAADGGDEDTRDAARTALRLYEERFGHAFVAVMSSDAPDELLMRVRIRLGNEPLLEWRTACDEQRRLTRLRLQRLLAATADE